LTRVRLADKVGGPDVLTTSGDHESTVGHSLPPGRVLIVDDVPQIVELLRDFLTEQGYEVHTAVTGIEALNAVVPFQPDVILLDMQMPRLSGLNVFDELRRAGLTVPVILISASPPNAREGFFATFTKPFKLDPIARTVAAAVEHRRRT
jgi:two-component system KDP operon response regulator KdpE